MINHNGVFYHNYFAFQVCPEAAIRQGNAGRWPSAAKPTGRAERCVPVHDEDER